MLQLFFDYQYLIHYEFISEKRTFNKEVYKYLKTVTRYNPVKTTWNLHKKDWFLLPDNGLPHRPLMVKQYLAKNIVTTLEHLLVRRILHWFFKIYLHSWKEHCSADSWELMENATRQLIKLSKKALMSVSNNCINSRESVEMQESILKQNNAKTVHMVTNSVTLGY